MLKSLLLAGLAAAAFTPALAQAQTACQEQRHDDRVAGTIVGAGIGAILGSAISGGRGGATVAGGVGGAVVGNAVGGSGEHCGENQYGYYENGAWVPRTATAEGYYGPDGQWVASPPPGYGPGPYAAPAYGQDAAYSDHGQHPLGTRDREDRMQQAIQTRMSDGRLNDRDGQHALRELGDIRRIDRDYRDANGGHLDESQKADLNGRLDNLRQEVHADQDGDPRPY